MTDRESNSPERQREHVPTPEEVRLVFQELIGKEYRIMRQLDDEKGLCIFEVEAAGDNPGEVNEYAYRRTLRYLQGTETEVDVPEIHVTYYKDGEPISGTSAARLVAGKWVIYKSPTISS